jgi:hypothetical protein
MRKYFLIAFVALCLGAKAQITLEHTYDSASTLASGSPVTASQLMKINFTVSGERYVNINRWGKSIEIYNMSHALVKTISLASLPGNCSSPSVISDILYLSENLFSTDSKIAFMYLYNYGCTSPPVTQIYNEDGVLLFSDTGYALVRIAFQLQQYPIYNSTQGAKMILSYRNMQAKVFSLPGTLTVGIQEANNNLIAMQTGNVSNAYPNPNNGSVKIDYTLPPGVNVGEIVFYNLMGNEIKRFKVDRTFNTLLISTKDIAAGTYYYQLQTTGESSGGKKMVVIK